MGYICIITLGYVYGNPTNSFVTVYVNIRVQIRLRLRLRVRVRVRVRVNSPLRSVWRVHTGLGVYLG